MMDFSYYLKTERYIHACTAIQTGHAQGLLYVENPSDISFWRCVIQHVAPKSYVVKPISKEKSAGKRTLEKVYPDLHKSYIVGVDSDFDYICPNRHERADSLNNNKFILHTFAYSRENYECCHESIEGLCDILYFHERLPSEIHNSLNKYSKIIYPALCLFAYLHNQNWQKHVDGIFIQTVKIASDSCLLTDDLKMNSVALEALQVKINTYIAEYTPQVKADDELEKFIAKMNEKGITENTAYLFINGHYLQENLIKPMLIKIIKATKLREKNYIEKAYPGDNKKNTRKDKKNEIENHYKKRNLDTLLVSRSDYTKEIFYEKIQNKLREIMG
ncbi:DUF4435 domain-containing protein [Serratia ureilytica]|nr:DUF4435 domain-containing protein [Serratia ureilytica]